MKKQTLLAWAFALALPAGMIIAADNPVEPGDKPLTPNQIDNSGSNSDVNTNGLSNPSASSSSEVKPNTPAASNTKASETEILSSLHHTNQMEIHMAQMAQARSQSQTVRDFADRLTTDHKQADNQTKQVADLQGIKLSDADKPIGKAEQSTMKRLEGLKGPAFDREFTSTMAKDHQKSIAMLEAAQPKLSGTPTGDLITQVLPVIREHYRIANELAVNLQQQVKPS